MEKIFINDVDNKDYFVTFMPLKNRVLLSKRANTLEGLCKFFTKDEDRQIFILSEDEKAFKEAWLEYFGENFIHEISEEETEALYR